MTLTDAREALAEQSHFIDYLVGLAGLARVVHALANDDQRSDPPRAPDDFVHALLGLAALGATIDRIANSTTAQQNPTSKSAATQTTRWLR